MEYKVHFCPLIRPRKILYSGLFSLGVNFPESPEWGFTLFTTFHDPYINGIFKTPLISGYCWGEPHSNVENGTVVHARRTAAKNGIATHYCSLVRWFMYKQPR